MKKISLWLIAITTAITMNMNAHASLGGRRQEAEIYPKAINAITSWLGRVAFGDNFKPLIINGICLAPSSKESAYLDFIRVDNYLKDNVIDMAQLKVLPPSLANLQANFKQAELVFDGKTLATFNLCE